MSSSTEAIRNGRGHRAYRRAQAVLAARYKANGWPCPGCGNDFDWENPQSSRGFTADHPLALNNGGRLVGQQLEARCRGCNARKGDVPTPVLVPATPPPAAL